MVTPLVIDIPPVGSPAALADDAYRRLLAAGHGKTTARREAELVRSDAAYVRTHHHRETPFDRDDSFDRDDFNLEAAS